MKKIYIIRSNAFDTMIGIDDKAGIAWYQHLNPSVTPWEEVYEGIADLDATKWRICCDGSESGPITDKATYRGILFDIEGSDILAEVIASGDMSAREMGTLAGDLYDKGWRSTNRELMIEEFADGLALTDINAIIDILKAYEAHSDSYRYANKEANNA